eukprot:CAMPEP_0184484528 /NCGR_PEP_ID=MMETSP0113_2-20130426/6235_1 /TAXON_ID=91329 /ORGANISM="Norrisiella sphaerica, Strain BC52" /LENGTH=1340 /DNA_ID=CAMNT_0026865549 /DNA_START=345 /DNA_END=4367 /DNA_ORIENTATION=-
MGCQISVINNKDISIRIQVKKVGVVRDEHVESISNSRWSFGSTFSSRKERNGKPRSKKIADIGLDQWVCDIKPNSRLKFRGDGLSPNVLYEYTCSTSASVVADRVHKGEKEVKAKSQSSIQFFAFQLDHGLQLRAEELMDAKWIRTYELAHLCCEILPGLRVQDRDYYGDVYDQCFIANELVTYILLHRIAQSAPHAVALCQRLLENDVFLRVADGFDFENRFMFFRLNEDHEIVKSKGSLTPVSLDSSQHKFSIQTASCDGQSTRITTMRSMGGWLERRIGKLAFWRMRYFRLLPCGPAESGMRQLSEFSDPVSATAIRSIRSDDVQYVQRKGKKGKNGSNIIVLTLKDDKERPSSQQNANLPNKTKYYLKTDSPENCESWLRVLHTFAAELTPLGVVKRSALAFLFDDNMAYAFAKLLKVVSVRQDQQLDELFRISQNFCLLKSGRIGIFMETEEGRYEKYAEQIPVSHFNEHILLECEQRQTEGQSFHFSSRENAPTMGAKSRSSSDATFDSQECDLKDPSLADYRKFRRTHTSPKLSLVQNKNLKIGNIDRRQALEPCVLLTMSDGDMKNLLKKYKIRARLKTVLEDGLNRCIKKVALFNCLNSSQLAVLKIGLRFHALKQDEVLCYEGDRSHSLFIVYEGALDVVKRHVERNESRGILLKTLPNEHVLRTLRKGDTVCENSLILPGSLHRNTLRASKKSLVLSLDSRTFQQFLKRMRIQLKDLLRSHMVASLSTFELPFLDDEFLRDSFLSNCDLNTFEKGETIISEGDKATKFYLIYFGQVIAMKKQVVLRVLHRGQYFGEGSFILARRRYTATCVAERPTAVLVIDPEWMKTLHPEVLAKIEIRLLGPRSELLTILNHREAHRLFEEFLEGIDEKESSANGEREDIEDEGEKEVRVITENTKGNTACGINESIGGKRGKQGNAINLLRFWKAMRLYSSQLVKKSPMSPFKVNGMAARIVNAFVHKDSKMFVPGLDQKIRNDILTEVIADAANSDTFRAAEKLILKQMSKRYLENFKRTMAFIELLETVNAYVTTTPSLSAIETPPHVVSSGIKGPSANESQITSALDRNAVAGGHETAKEKTRVWSVAQVRQKDNGNSLFLGPSLISDINSDQEDNDPIFSRRCGNANNYRKGRLSLPKPIALISPIRKMSTPCQVKRMPKTETFCVESKKDKGKMEIAEIEGKEYESGSSGMLSSKMRNVKLDASLRDERKSTGGGETRYVVQRSSHVLGKDRTLPISPKTTDSQNLGFTAMPSIQSFHFADRSIPKLGNQSFKLSPQNPGTEGGLQASEAKIKEDMGPARLDASSAPRLRKKDKRRKFMPEDLLMNSGFVK